MICAVCAYTLCKHPQLVISQVLSKTFPPWGAHYSNVWLCESWPLWQLLDSMSVTFVVQFEWADLVLCCVFYAL